MVLPTPTLHTPRLRLRPFTDADADALFALHSSAYVLRYWDSPPWSERARAERFIAACRQMADEGTGARLAIDRGTDGAFIGWCSLTRWNPDHRSASLGYCLDDEAWGHGYATEAVRALLQWAFDALELNRVQAETDTRNGASARVLAKLGFLREGTLREDCVVNGEVSDSWVFGLIRREWGPSHSDRADSDDRDDHDEVVTVETGRRGQRLICEGWFASHADGGAPGPHLHLRTSDGETPVLRTDQLPTLIAALSAVAERIDRAWAIDGDQYTAEVVLRSPDPQDPRVIKQRRRERLSLTQAVHENLPDVMRLLIEASSTDEALNTIAALLDFDEVDVMVGLARFDLLTLTRPATERRLRILAEPED